MVDAVNIVGSGNTAAAISQQNAGVTTAAAASTKTAPQSTTTNAAPAPGAADYYAHRFFSDPSSGIFITEQLDTKGDVTYQDPQGIALAYLRNGLTSTGLPKQTVTA